MEFQLKAVATGAVLATATAQVQLSGGTGSISISPNPAIVTDGTGLAIVTVGFSSSVPSAGLFANGTLFCTAQSGYCATGKWVSNGMVFTLADTANGIPIASATAVVQSASGTISLAQNPVVAAPGSNLGTTTVDYSANVGASVYVNVRRSSAVLDLSGSCQTGRLGEQRLGVPTVLVDVGNHAVLASVTAHVVPSN